VIQADFGVLFEDDSQLECIRFMEDYKFSTRAIKKGAGRFEKNGRPCSAYLCLHPSCRPSATSSNISLTLFTCSTCASTSPRFLMLITARAARANSYNLETDTSIAVASSAVSLTAAAEVGRSVCADEAKAAERSTLDARRIARSRGIVWSVLRSPGRRAFDALDHATRSRYSSYPCSSCS
jgi:hypothetical protein